MKHLIEGIDTVKTSESESNIAKIEKGDCVVRALSVVFDISYDEAHKFAKEKFQRKDKDGVYDTLGKMRRLKTAFDKKIVEVGEYDENCQEVVLSQKYRMHGKTKEGKYTTVTFLKKFPTGVYFVLVRRHAFAIVDGVVYGNKADALRRRKRILHAFKIE